MTCRFTLPLLGLVALSGCGESGPTVDTLPTEEVSGTVTYKGTPIAGATLVFSPVVVGKDSKPAQGQTNDEGVYTLTTSFSPSVHSPGAVAGDYLITISKMKSAGAAPTTESSSPSPEQMASGAHGAQSAPPPRRRSSTKSALNQADSELPVKYADKKTSGLKVAVPGGSYDFALAD